MSDQPVDDRGPLLVSISDIDVNNPQSYNIESIGYMLGVMDMRQAMVIIEPLMPGNGQAVIFMITTENWMETAQKLYSMAVFNYASSIHEKFEVPALEQNMAQKFSRIGTAEQNRAAMEKYLYQMMMILEKYCGTV